MARALTEAGAGQIGNYSGCSFRWRGPGLSFRARVRSRPLGNLGAVSEEPEVRLELVVPKRLEARVVAALRAAHPYEEPAFDLHEVRSNLGLIGRVGNLESPMALGEFSDRVGEMLNSRAAVLGRSNPGCDPGGHGAGIGWVIRPGGGGRGRGRLRHRGPQPS